MVLVATHRFPMCRYTHTGSAHSPALSGMAPASHNLHDDTRTINNPHRHSTRFSSPPNVPAIQPVLTCLQHASLRYFLKLTVEQVQYGSRDHHTAMGRTAATGVPTTASSQIAVSTRRMRSPDTVQNKQGVCHDLAHHGASIESVSDTPPVPLTHFLPFGAGDFPFAGGAFGGAAAGGLPLGGAADGGPAFEGGAFLACCCAGCGVPNFFGGGAE